MDRRGRGEQLSRIGALALVGVLGALSACRSAPACPVDLRTDPLRALEDHARHQVGWEAIKAEARVTQWAERGRIRGTVLMYLQKPGRVRFDVMTQFGPAAVLTSDGELFQLSDLRDNVFVEGPTCSQNVARLLGIEVEPDDVLRLLSGDTPLIDAEQRSIECRKGQYVVVLESPEGTTQELVFSIDDREAPASRQRLTLVRSSVRSSDGVLQWEATYDDYVRVDAHSFPSDVRFIDHVHDADTQVRVKAISVDPDVPDDAFRQSPSPGMRFEAATCQ